MLSHESKDHESEDVSVDTTPRSSQTNSSFIELNLYPGTPLGSVLESHFHSIRINEYLAGHATKWTADEATQISGILKDHPTLKKVVIALKKHDDLKIVLGFLQCLTGKAQIIALHLSIYQGDPDFLNALGLLLLKKTCIRELKIQAAVRYIPLLDVIDTTKLSVGIGGLTNLQHLNLSELPLGDNGIKTLSNTMKNITGLIELRLVLCGITDGVESIASILNRNRCLKVLSLSGNTLKNAGIDILLTALFALEQLQSLYLAYMGIDYSTLCETITTNRMPAFDITSDKSPYFDFITDISFNNKQLSVLDLRGAGIDRKVIELLQPRLMKHPLCRLNELVFCEFADPTFYELLRPTDLLLPILERNHHIRVLGCQDYQKRYLSHYMASDRNLRYLYVGKWDTFIQRALWMFVALHTVLSLKSIPSVIMQSILLFIQPNTPNKNKQSIMSCLNLVEHNVNRRYSSEPTAIDKTKSPAWWWSTSNPLINHGQQLFLQKKQVTPNFMNISELINQIQLCSKYVKKSDKHNKETCIQIDLSKQTDGYRRYVHDLFVRYISSYKHCGMAPQFNKNVLQATVSISATGMVIVGGITMAELKQAIASTSTAHELKRTCNVM